MSDKAPKSIQSVFIQSGIRGSENIKQPMV